MLLSKITCGVNFFQNLTLLKAFFGKSRNSIIYCIFIYKKNLLNPHMHRSDYREIVNSKVWKMWLNSSVIYWFTKRLFGPLGRPLITWRMTWLETDYRDRSEQRWSCSFITILVILVCLRNWNIVYDKSLLSNLWTSLMNQWLYISQYSQLYSQFNYSPSASDRYELIKFYNLIKRSFLVKLSRSEASIVLCSLLCCVAEPRLADQSWWVVRLTVEKDTGQLVLA